MSDNNNNNLVDQYGNAFTFNDNNTVKLAGSGFTSSILVATLATSALWLGCFTALLFMFVKIRSNMGSDSDARKYLRGHVIGLSIFSTIGFYAIDVYNRVIHEKQEKTHWWILYITIPQNLLAGLAIGTFTKFLFRQFTPYLLSHSQISAQRKILTVFTFLSRVIYIAVALDKIASAVLYAVKIDQIRGVSGNNYSKHELQVLKYTKLGATVSNTVFAGGYLMCIIAFAFTARTALRELGKFYTISKRFRRSLVLLTVCIALRCALDLVWILIFQVARQYIHPKENKFVETQKTYVVFNAIYGFFSVTIYASVLRIASASESDLSSPPAVEYEASGANASFYSRDEGTQRTGRSSTIREAERKVPIRVELNEIPY